MRLLFFSATLKGGGAERVLANITNELVNRGHDIMISLNINETFYKLDQRIKIVSPPLYSRYIGKNLFHRLKDHCIQRIQYSNHTRSAIKVFQPDVIITFMHCNLWPIIRYHGKVPIIHSEHNAYDRALGCSWYFRRFVLNRFFNCVFVLTPFDQGFAKAKGLKNTIVMPNPNSFDSVEITEYENSFPLRKNILVCGRIHSWYIKGVDIAIDAFAKIANRYPEIDLDIVGDGEDGDYRLLKQLAAKLGVEQRVHFLGQINDIQSIMRQHMFLVLSSRTEGFPMVVTEAMSQGLPCVAFERLASSIIVDGVDGVLVKDENSCELAQSISHQLCEAKQRYNMGLEAVKNVNRFSVGIVADRWEKVINSLLAHH